MAEKDLKIFLKELGNPSIEEVYNNLADTLKYLSDNYGKDAISGKDYPKCMISNNKMLEVLSVLTTATVWLKVNQTNFKK